MRTIGGCFARQEKLRGLRDNQKQIKTLPLILHPVFLKIILASQLHLRYIEHVACLFLQILIPRFRSCMLKRAEKGHNVNSFFPLGFF